ncbi:hypothetical protein [Stenotrophomonas sp.]|uniref:hypothetical protein n=1 Tax=Stenotrophomonas sp. TaxID=69392 RepID=UPI0028B12DA9|nr:hypothetical protein [Stenotrophomonas sp.]
MHAHPLTRSLLRGTCLLLPAALLSACGGHKEVAKASPPVTDKIVELQPSERDGRGSYRFLMSDGDKRMSADEFDAWMKSNGIRVAKGNPNAAPKPVVVASKEDPKDKKKKKK